MPGQSGELDVGLGGVSFLPLRRDPQIDHEVSININLQLEMCFCKWVTLQMEIGHLIELCMFFVSDFFRLITAFYLRLVQNELRFRV